MIPIQTPKHTMSLNSLLIYISLFIFCSVSNFSSIRAFFIFLTLSWIYRSRQSFPDVLPGSAFWQSLIWVVANAVGLALVTKVLLALFLVLWWGIGEDWRRARWYGFNLKTTLVLMVLRVWASMLR